ncbi:glutamine-synthetase adenylyltransferase [Roseobacter sp. HKCCA0434]|uniref:[protein-PII] uridylyltransferase family protein n=1 Tax=Roseobacter sp. HKCCA0434 TaxID=3079297 RepID=UPI00290596CC|nr:glutamine-synthetase adenylyltransferase [Roseobacter sp. HKCCA0434]
MTGFHGITRVPRAVDPQAGREAASGFSGPLADLITGAAGSSHHIARLMRKEGDWLASIAEAPLERTLDTLCTQFEGDPATALRQAKRRVGLMTALADLGGLWPTMQVTQALSRFADAALAHATDHLIARQVARGKLPDDPGYVVLAMGKLGAGELNYSSDIDLVCLIDEDRHDPSDFAEARATLIRVTRDLAQMIGGMTAEGYVFRTDLRLRPDPSTTPVCIGMDAAERYYESQGRTWERAAYIKARPAAGDLAAGDAFLDRLAPFIWRRHLDFAAIRDVTDMMHRIRDHKGLAGPIDPRDHDVKLGRGGIREIEFFAQTRQLIAGGRDPALRCRATLDALEALVGAGHVTRADADRLARHYPALRDMEHRIQMLEDAQTQAMPQNDDALDRLAALSGYDAPGPMLDALADRLAEVHHIAMPETAAAEEKVEPFVHTPETRAITDSWPGLPALRSPRAEALFHELAPGILARLGQAADPHAALVQFDAFLRGLPAGVQVFSLFEANPALQDLLAEICAAAPRLARHLGRNSDVLDAVLDRSFFHDLPERPALQDELAATLAAEEDYEAKLDAARRWQKEVHFRIGVHLLRGLADAQVAERAYSDLAAACLDALLPVVVAEQAIRHGPPPGDGLAVLGMGKLGSGEMTARSDLDLILLYDAPREEMSDGPKPLAASQYFARLTKRLVTALSAPMAQGMLYEVDMRLRPSGRQGPVATALSAFRTYQAEEAWTWEHLALTRARPVAGDPELQTRIAKAVAEVLALPRDAQTVRRDTADMRRRLALAKPGSGPWEVKEGPGRLLDIDLYLQMGHLLSGASAPTVAALREVGWLSDDDAETLSDARNLMRCVQAIARVALEPGHDPIEAGPGFSEVLLQHVHEPDLVTLQAQLADCARAAARLIDGHLPQ